MTAKAFPLHWPQGFPRWKSSRARGAFRVDFDAALRNVRRSLEGFAKDSGKIVEAPVLSSNLDLNPLTAPSGRQRIDDPGVAVWFTWDGMQVCIPVDRYDSPAANLQAIHHILEARRVELRHGTLALVRATFSGFKALPAPEGEHWRDVLGLEGMPAPSVIQSAYKLKARDAHPDRIGGNAEAMARLNAARDAALAEVGQ
jgi:hypothetical protein